MLNKLYRERIMAKSIQIKISIVLLVSILSIMIVSGLILYYFESKKLLQELTANSKLTYKRLTNSLREPLWNMDYKEVGHIVMTEMENHDVFLILVFNDKNQRISSLMKDINFDIVKYDDTLIDKKFLYYESEIVKDDIKIGFLQISFTDHFLKRSLGILIFRLLIQTIVLTIITIIIVYIAISRQIIHPIIQLNRTVGRFADKDFDARIEINSDDEIGSLSANFNNMAETIQEYSESMEELVAKRTEELKEANDELLEANQQMKKELKMAQKIQQAIIPKTFPDIQEFCFSGMYIPMESLGGDYYDVIKISENKIGMLIVDVCGHGVPAALITTMAKVSFSSNAKSDRKTGEIVKIVNDELFNIIGNMEYLTAFFCIIDTEKGIIEYTNAGHPSTMIIKKNGGMIELNQNSPVIGFLNNVKFETNVEKIDDGDRIVLYTDGVTEAKNETGDLYDFERFRDILLANINLSNKELIETISKEINSFTGNTEISDDVTILIGDFSKGQGKIMVDFEIFSEKKKQDSDKDSSEEKNKISELNEKLYAALEYNKLSEYDKSLVLLEEIKGKYNRNEENIKVLEMLGFVNYKLGKFDKAILIWKELLEMDPENIKIKNNLRILNERK